MDIETLERRRAGLLNARQDIVDRAKDEGRDCLTVNETAQFEALGERLATIADTLQRSGYGNSAVEAARLANARAGVDGGTGSWAARAATALAATGGESRAVTSGSIDVPQLIEPNVTPKARAERLIDLLVNRKSLDGNAFEYYRQSVRTNLAAVVADAATKPTSTFTVTPITDRARVIAHLSEPIPGRLLFDHPALERWLDLEMSEGVLDALEDEIISGSGSGEHMTGIRTVAGTTAVAYGADLLTTLRSAVTAMQIAGETPTAWVLNPVDAQLVDMARWSFNPAAATQAGFITDGYQSGNAGSNNVFGPTLPRVVSNSVPAGQAILGDFDQVCVYVRESTTITLDASGPDLFDKNLVKVRAEGRFGIGVLRPSAFALVDLTP